MIHTAPIQLRRAASADPEQVAALVGLASTWAVDMHNSRIAPGAFDESIAELEAGRVRIPLLFEHDTSVQLGTVQTARETDAGLEIEAALVRAVPQAARVIALAQAAPGSVGLSLGFAPVRDATVKDGRITVYTRATLLEVSTVAMPSNRQSHVYSVRGLSATSEVDLVRMLKAGELPALPGRLAKRAARELAPLLRSIEAGDDTDPADVRALSVALANLNRELRGQR